MKTKKLVQAPKSKFFFGFKYLCTYCDMISYLECLLFFIGALFPFLIRLGPFWLQHMKRRELIGSIISRIRIHSVILDDSATFALYLQSVVGASPQVPRPDEIIDKALPPPTYGSIRKRKRKVIYHAAGLHLLSLKSEHFPKGA